MKIKRAYRKQKNFKRSFPIIAAIPAIIVFAFLVALYTFGVRILTDNVKEQTLNEMDFVENNVLQSSVSIREFVKYLYSKNAFKSIIEDDIENMEEISLSVNRAFNEMSIVMPYITSIQFYNGATDKMYYTGYGSLVDAEQEKKELKELKNTAGSFDSVLRSIRLSKGGNAEARHNVISYFMYSEIENGSFITFNIDISWIYDFIKSDRFSDISLLLDEQGTVIRKNVATEDSERNAEIEEFVQKYKNTLLKDYGSVISRIQGKRYLIICRKLQTTGVVAFRAYPLNEIYRAVNKFRLYILVIGVLFEAIIFGLYIFFSDKVYEPILEFLNAVQTPSVSRRFRLQSQESELWHTVCNNNGAEQGQREAILKKYGIDMSESEIVVVVLETENYYELCAECTRNEINAMMQEVCKTALSMVNENFPCIGINGANGTVILFVAADERQGEIFGELKKCFEEFSTKVFESLEVSVSAYISEGIKDADKIPETIVALMSSKVYRYNYHPRCCILLSQLQENRENQDRTLSRELMEKLQDDIVSRNAENVDETMSLIIEEISRMEYYAELPQLLYLAKEVEELFVRLSSKSLFEVKNLSRELVSCEYISEAKALFCNKIKKLITDMQIEDKLKSENSIKSVAKMAKEMIENEYSDVGLCADYIAEKLGVSSRKLSSGFKDIYDMSMVEYINNLRLEKSIEILKEQKVSVKDVVSMVGFGNEAYFYRVFKKKYGTTPLKYVELNQE